VILLDASGSTRERWKVIKKAAKKFIDTLSPNTPIAVAAFTRRFMVICDFTCDRKTTKQRIDDSKNLQSGTAFYDATRPSRLHRLLQDGPELTPEQNVRARLAIDKIVATKVSKYNAAPDFALGAGTPGKKKVLLVDQRLGDQSVTSGLADEFSFKRMLQDAIRLHPDCDILIKKHPDAITGGKESYYNEERLVSVKGMKNVFPVMVDINPYALLADVEEVYVVSSHLGFEALLAGKKVHCYGAPFYAGWGLTDDEIPVPGRTRKRRLEDIFHFAYIASSRYFHPELDRVVEVEELIDYVREQRDLRLGTA